MQTALSYGFKFFNFDPAFGNFVIFALYISNNTTLLFSMIIVVNNSCIAVTKMITLFKYIVVFQKKNHNLIF